VRAIGDERAHVLHREPVGEVVAAPPDDIEGVRRVHAAGVDAVDLRDDLEASGLVPVSSVRGNL